MNGLKGGICILSQISVKFLLLAIALCMLWEGSEIHVTNSERDLSVIMDEDLKFDSHVIDKVYKANRILGLIRRNIYALGCI